MPVTVNHFDSAEAHAVRVASGRPAAGVVGIRYFKPRRLGQTLYGAPPVEAAKTILRTLDLDPGAVIAISSGDVVDGVDLRRTDDGRRVAVIEHGAIGAIPVNAWIAHLRRRGWRPERAA